MIRLVLLFAILGCSLAQFNRQFSGFNKFTPYNRFNTYNQPRHFTTPTPVRSVAVEADAIVVPSAVHRPSAVNQYNYLRHNEQDAEILRSTNDVNPDGHFAYSYETSNGIKAHAVGTPKNLGGVPANVPTVIEGSYSWVAPDGTPVSIGYVADEYGYRAVGDAIPTPPPIPAAILRSLQYRGLAK